LGQATPPGLLRSNHSLLKHAFRCSLLVALSTSAFGQGLNLVQTQTPGVVANLGNGGRVDWYPATSSVTTSFNWFGNTPTITPPNITLTTSCLGAPFLTNNNYFTAMLILFDQAGDAVYSTPTASVKVPGSGNYCPQLLANPVISGPAGATLFMLAGCQAATANCTNFTILSDSTTLAYGSPGYGPFDATFSVTDPNQPKFVAPNANGPLPPPPNTSGLIVSDINLELGSSTFLTRVPIVTGTYSRITGDNGQSTVIQAAPGFPSAIPALGEPAGFLAPTGGGSIGNSTTVAFGLYDWCGGSGNLVTVGPPHTFPPFVTGNQQITVFNPGIPRATSLWASNAQYWGSSTATCAGERVVVTTPNNAVIYILRATTIGVSSATQPAWNTAAVPARPRTCRRWRELRDTTIPTAGLQRCTSITPRPV